MKLKIKAAIILTISLFCFSCKKDHKVVPGSNVDVYVIGTTLAGNNEVAACWKNGVMTKLADTSTASSAMAIATNGADVYVVGYTTNGATLWKNNVASKLGSGNPSTDALTAAYAIVIKNDDVYVAGSASLAVGQASHVAYWKNGVIKILNDTTNVSIGYGIAVNGNDVYVVGNNFFGAFCWKNDLESALSGSAANCVTTNGSDVYIGGAIHNNYNTAYWKNNVPTVVSDSSFLYGATAILLNGNDVYLTGTKYNKVETMVATYWKNGVAHSLSNGITNSTANGIAVDGSDVYVAGGPYYVNSLSGGYWKNGVMTTLPKCFKALGIAVIPH